jgi:hypothetical protein
MFFHILVRRRQHYRRRLKHGHQLKYRLRQKHRCRQNLGVNKILASTKYRRQPNIGAETHTAPKPV